jgi:hypothetical protein
LVLFFGDNITEIGIPLVEEGARLISVIIGPPLLYVYTTVFVIFENIVILSEYPIEQGYEFSTITIRIFVSMFHFFLLWIQYRWYKKYKETNDKMKIFIGFLLAYIIHVYWNIVIGHRIFNILISL